MLELSGRFHADFCVVRCQAHLFLHVLVEFSKDWTFFLVGLIISELLSQLFHTLTSSCLDSGQFDRFDDGLHPPVFQRVACPVEITDLALCLSSRE